MQGQHALVTGGAGGIGLELAKACLRRGASVSIIDLAKEMSTAREELTQAKPDHGPILSFNFYNADVGNFAEVCAPLQCMHEGLLPVSVATTLT